MTLAEERAFLVRSGAGDAAARDVLIRSHIPLVVAISRPYFRNPGVDPNDLISEGFLGLIAAVDRFDARRYSCRLSTYAVYRIRQHILDYLKAPRNRAHQPLPKDTGDRWAPPDDAEIADIEEADQHSARLRAACASLDPEARAIVSYRHALDGHPFLTIKTIAHTLGRSQSYIFQKYRVAIRKLRREITQ